MKAWLLGCVLFEFSMAQYLNRSLTQVDHKLQTKRLTTFFSIALLKTAPLASLSLRNPYLLSETVVSTNQLWLSLFISNFYLLDLEYEGRQPPAQHVHTAHSQQEVLCNAL